jgi:hypothetical protein
MVVRLSAVRTDRLVLISVKGWVNPRAMVLKEVQIHNTRPSTLLGANWQKFQMKLRIDCSREAHTVIQFRILYHHVFSLKTWLYKSVIWPFVECGTETWFFFRRESTGVLEQSFDEDVWIWEHKVVRKYWNITVKWKTLVLHILECLNSHP